MSEIKVALIIIPESYDYGIEDIVYRIYVNEQLIVERSMPLLEENQAIVDTFFLDNLTTKKYNIQLDNLKLKNVQCKSIVINDINLGNIKNLQTKDYVINFNQTMK